MVVECMKFWKTMNFQNVLIGILVNANHIKQTSYHLQLMLGALYLKLVDIRSLG